MGGWVGRRTLASSREPRARVVVQTISIAMGMEATRRTTCWERWVGGWVSELTGEGRGERGGSNELL